MWEFGVRPKKGDSNAGQGCGIDDIPAFDKTDVYAVMLRGLRSGNCCGILFVFMHVVGRLGGGL